MTCRPRRIIHAAVALVVTSILTCGASRVEAQIGPIPPGLADPRPDPLLLMPVVTTNTQMRVSGVVMTPVKSPRDSIAPALVGTTPTVRGRLTFFLPDGTPLSFPVAFQSVPDTLARGRTGFMGTIKTYELIGDTPANTGAVLALHCTNCPRGSRLSAGVYVEEVSLVKAPSFVSYFVGAIDPKVDPLIDPKTDPALDPKTDPVIDPKIDPLVLIPGLTLETRFHVTGFVHSRRGVRDPDTLGLTGRLTLFLPDGRSQNFEIQFQTIVDKATPHRLGFSAVGTLNGIGDMPPNSSAALTFDCANCPRGTQISAGVYVEEVSALPNPSFVPYYAGMLDQIDVPIRR